MEVLKENQLKWISHNFSSKCRFPLSKYMVILEVNTYLLPFEVKLPSFNSYVVCNAPDAKGVRGRKRGREVLA